MSVDQTWLTESKNPEIPVKLHNLPYINPVAISMLEHVGMHSLVH